MKFRYFKISMQKGMKGFGYILAGTLFVMILMGIAVLGIEKHMHEKMFLEAIRVGIVIPKSERQTRLASCLLRDMDSVKETCDFCYMDLEDAMQKVHEGRIDAAILIPEGFYRDLNEGRNAPAKLLMKRKTAESLKGEIFLSLSSCGVSLIQTGETGIYAAGEIYFGYSGKKAMREIENRLTEIYMGQVFGRLKLFDRRWISDLYGEKKIPIGIHYTVAGLLSVLLLSGVGFGNFYRSEVVSIERKLRMYGISEKNASFIRLSAGTIILYLLFVLLYIVTCAGMPFLAQKAGAFPGMGDFSSILQIKKEIFIFILPSLSAVSGFIFFVYSAVRPENSENVSYLAASVFLIAVGMRIGPVRMVVKYTVLAFSGHMDLAGMVTSFLLGGLLAGAGGMIWHYRNI